MKRGSEKAKAIQTILKKEGFYNGIIDGIFGRKSRSALRRYQKYHGLVADGIYGQQTEGYMFKDVANHHQDTPDVSEIKKYPKEISRNQKTLKEFYGEPGTNLVKIRLPYDMYLTWGDRDRVRYIYVNKKAKKAFLGAFNEILEVIGIDDIQRLGLDQYGGAFNKRPIRGGKRWSTHAFGCSIDIDPEHNGLRTHSPRARFSGEEYRTFHKIMEKWGFYSLGLHHDYDWMHFQLCWR